MGLKDGRIGRRYLRISGAGNSARPIPEPLPYLGGAQVRAVAGEDLIGQFVQHLARLGELVVLKVGVRDPGHRDQLGDRPAPQGLGDVDDIARISPFDFSELRPMLKRMGGNPAEREPHTPQVPAET